MAAPAGVQGRLASPYAKSLDGDWSFQLVDSPEQRDDDFYGVSFDDSAWSTIKVPSNWYGASLPTSSAAPSPTSHSCACFSLSKFSPLPLLPYPSLSLLWSESFLCPHLAQQSPLDRVTWQGD
jgi:hypothetical protein